MIPVKLHQETYYFAIIHVTRQLPDKVIYGIVIKSEHYYLSKSVGINGCVQLDSHPRMAQPLLNEIDEILTRFELLYHHYPELEMINQEIIKALDLNRSAVQPGSKPPEQE
jgi:hypothetical protein